MSTRTIPSLKGLNASTLTSFCVLRKMALKVIGCGDPIFQQKAAGPKGDDEGKTLLRKSVNVGFTRSVISSNILLEEYMRRLLKIMDAMIRTGCEAIMTRKISLRYGGLR